MLQEDSFSSQEADYKSETQLKPRRPTDILQEPHPDLEFYLYVLEIHEQMFFRKLASKGCFLKKKKKNQKKKTQNKNKNKNRKTATTTTATTKTTTTTTTTTNHN